VLKDLYYHFGIVDRMPTYRHKDTGKRFFFIHIPKTAGRFLQENFKLNGFEPEQNIWDWIDGIETAHFHRELYQKHLNIKDIKHVSIVRDPLQRYLSLKTHNYPDSENWLRPQVDYVTEETNIWKFEDGFDEKFSTWLSEMLETHIKVKELDSDYTYNHKGQRLFLEYKDPNYEKIESTDEIVNHVKSFYQEDYKVWYNSLNK